MERLSSGMRINSAKDDAAGQAQRNANDGISIAQTAEGALEQVNENVQRVRELAVQAANDTLTTADRQSIQDEVDQRLLEVNRIADETKFNDLQPLSSERSIDIQVGSQDGETIPIDLYPIDSNELGLQGLSVGGFPRPPFATASDFENSVYYQSDGKNYRLSSADVSSVVDLLDADTSERALLSNGDGYSANGVNDLYTKGKSYSDFTIPKQEITSNAGNYKIGNQENTDNSLPRVNIEVASNGDITTAGGARFGLDADGAYVTGGSVVTEVTNVDNIFPTSDSSIFISISGQDAGNQQIEITSNNTGNVFGLYLKDTTRQEVEQAFSGDVVSYLGDDFSVSADGEKVSLDNQQQFIDEVGNFTSEARLAIRQDDGTFQDASGNAWYYDADNDALTIEPIIPDPEVPEPVTPDILKTIDTALSQIDTFRSGLGAVQNRFESAIENLSTTETNLSDARSRIEDADYAAEVANMTKAQILQQAGTSILAQANQIPQNVLSLLG